MESIVSILEQGRQVIMSGEEYDKLVDYLDSIDHKYFNKLCSLLNPQRVGTRDELLVFFKGIDA